MCLNFRTKMCLKFSSVVMRGTIAITNAVGRPIRYRVLNTIIS